MAASILTSTNTTPIPTGPRQYAAALTFSHAFAVTGATENWFGSLQQYIANPDGTNPLLLGAAIPFASDKTTPPDAAAVALKAAVLVAVQAYIQAKGL